jgi:hypothetical protein
VHLPSARFSSGADDTKNMCFELRRIVGCCFAAGAGRRIAGVQSKGVLERRS